MFSLSKIAACAVLGTLVVGGFGLPTYAEEPVEHTGPVGPHEPILTRFGGKGMIAFYESDGSHCGLYAVVYNLSDDSGATAARVRISLNARQVVNIDGPDNKSISLQCGEDAEALRIVDSDTVVASWPER